MSRSESLRTWALVHAFLQHGSLAKAALAEGIELSDASRRMSALEKLLGVPLLDRTTRPAGATENLKRYAACASRIARASRDIDRITAAIHAEAAPASVRTVRLSLPVNMDKAAVLSALQQFEDSHPDVRIELSADSGIPQLLAGKTDISMGGYLMQLPELFAMHVEESYNFLMATKAYLKRHGTPKTIEDLESPRHRVLLRNHDNLFFSNRLESSSGETFYLGDNVNLFYGDAAACRDRMLAGEGIGADLHIGYVSEAIAAGTVVPVLPGWHRAPWSYYVYCRTSCADDPVIRELMAIVQKNAFRSIANQWRFWYRRLGLPTPVKSRIRRAS